MPFTKILVLVLFLVIVLSLFSALYFLIKDKGQSNRTVQALTVRISLSIVAFLILVIAGLAGWITPNARPF